MRERKPRGFWTKENCLKVAKLCNTRSDFQKKYPQAWKKCKENGWLEEAYSHMVVNTVIRGYWQNYDNCYNAAKQCTTASEFGKRFPQAHRVALRNKWTKDYTWFVSGFVLAIQKNSKWTYETCAEESKKYKTRSEFQKGTVGAYQKALRKGWLDDYVWLNRGLDIYGKPDCVYKYEFNDFNTIYIGRTINKRDRDRAHIFCINNDAVAKFANNNNIPVPEMKILADNLTIEEGQQLEDEWKNYYIKLGYNVLNKGATGKNKGSIGSIGGGKWNYETCYKEAQKYKTRKEFQNNNVSAYTRALQYKWLEDYTWFKPAQTGQTRWTRERCYEEAKRYIYTEDFRQLSKVAYNKSRKNGWQDDYVWLSNKPKQTKISNRVVFWTKDKCYEEAKKYKTRTEFQYAKGASAAYKKSVKNGWIKEYEWMQPKVKQNGYWNNYERCFNEAKKYKTRTEFQYAKGASRAYKYSVQNGWIDSFTWMQPKQKESGYWTKERCILESKKYQRKNDFRKKSPSAYTIAKRNGWYKDFIWLVDIRKRKQKVNI